MKTSTVEEGRQSGRVRTLIRSHRLLVWIMGGIGLALIAFVILWFQPQKLFVEETIDEALPGVERNTDKTGGAANDETTEGAEPKTLAAGEFRSLDHATAGTASILELPNGSRYLRFEDLETSNGPDLRVYLSEIPAGGDSFAYGDDFVDLGALKGNRGNQNYELPEDLDLSPYKSAVIWCRRFTVGFGVAPLES
jgi:hypothetical protein